MGEWMWLWFETYSKPNLRPSSVENYSNYIRYHIEPNIGKIKLKQLKPLQIQQFYNRTKESGRVKRWEGMEDLSLSNRVVRAIHMVLRQALQQAANERLINHNPCDNCRIPKLEKKEMKIIPPEQIGAYLKQAKEKGMLPMFYLELTSGLRRGKLLALLWTDLDVEKRTITVNKSVSRVNGELVVSEPKTQNSVRTVAIPQQAVDLLVEDRKNHPDSPYLFPSPRTGGMWSPDAIGRTHKALLRAAEDILFHATMREIEAQLEEQPFFRCSSVIVNLAQVEAVDRYQVLVHGHWLAVSRAKKRELMEAMNRYASRL